MIPDSSSKESKLFDYFCFAHCPSRCRYSWNWTDAADAADAAIRVVGVAARTTMATAIRRQLTCIVATSWFSVNVSVEDKTPQAPEMNETQLSVMETPVGNWIESVSRLAGSFSSCICKPETLLKPSLSMITLFLLAPLPCCLAYLDHLFAILSCALSSLGD